jgi:hypothetical protein
VIGAVDRQAEGRHVVHALGEATIELLVARADLQDRALPFFQRFGVLGLAAVRDAAARRGVPGVTVEQVVQQAAVPGFRGSERNLEADAAVGPDARPAGRLGRDEHLAAEVAVAISEAPLLAAFAPVVGDAAAADDAVALHLEDVGEIAAHRDFEVEAHRVAAVVRDVDVFVHPAGDVAAESQPEGARGDRTCLGQESAVGLVDARAVIVDRAAVQQVPGLAVGEQAPATDQTGVEEVEALVAGPGDLAIGFGHQDCLSLVDRDLRRPDLYSERHDRLPSPGHCLRAGASGIGLGQQADVSRDHIPDP